MPPPNRRDRLQSHQFVLARTVSAFVARDTDPIRSPFRRGGTAVFLGTMLTVLMIAGFGVYGLVRPGGNTSWRAENTLVVEKETGESFLYRDGRLFPMQNFTSGRLLAEPGSDVRSVSANSLAGTTRGPLLGIVGAPASLPAPELMLRGPWSSCSRPHADRAPTSLLMVGRAPTGGVALGDGGVLVQQADTGAVDLLLRNHRHRLGDGVLDALALTQRPRTVVAPAWLEALPRGADIVDRVVPGTGGESVRVPGARVGQVWRVRSEAGTTELYVVEADGVRPITELAAAVALGSENTAPAYPGVVPGFVDVGPAAVAGVPRTAAPDEGAGEPDATGGVGVLATLPELREVPAAAAVCAVFDGPGGVRELRLAVDALPEGRPAPPVGDGAPGTRPADEVWVPPGRAALAEGLTSPDAPAGALSLVTDTGVRHGLPGVDVVSALGYGTQDVLRLPSALVDRVPAGPALSPEVAARPAVPTG